MKKIGEEASWGYEETGIGLKFKVISIKPIQCDSPGSTPTGTTLAIALEISTNEKFIGPLVVDGKEGQISFESLYWRGYEPDGTRMNEIGSTAASNCLLDRSGLLPNTFGKNEKLKGITIVDVTTPTGTLVFDPAGGDGWAWQY